jgi:hypothetical protein
VSSDDRFGWFIAGALIIVLALCAVFLIAADEARAEDERACDQRGGKLVCHVTYCYNGVCSEECNCMSRKMFR